MASKGPEASAVASTSASAQLGLKSSEDMLRLPILRKKAMKEKAQVEANLASCVSTHLDSTRDAMRKMTRARDTVGKIKDELLALQKSTDGSGGSNIIRDFEQLAQMSRVHRNLTQTEALVHRLKTMWNTQDMVKSLIEEDAQDPTGTQENLLVAHFHILQLESLRDTTIFQAKSTTPDTIRRMDQYFASLGTLISRFDDHLWQVVRGALPIATLGNQTALVKVAKIVSVEEGLDAKAVGMKFAKKALGDSDAAGRFKSIQAQARKIKHYRIKLEDTIRSSVREKLEILLAESRMNGAQDFLTSLPDIVFPDLVLIQDNISPCFPSDWEIYKVYVKAYHNNLDSLLNRIMADSPDAQAMLKVYQWLRNYAKELKDTAWGIDPDWITPALLNGQENDVMKEYVKLLVLKGAELLHRATDESKREFIVREQQPNVDNAVIIFNIINAQCDTAVASSQAAILAQVVTETASTVKDIQTEWRQLLERETEAYTSNTEEKPGGLDIYIAALANEQIACANATDALMSRLEAVNSTRYQDIVRQMLDGMMAGFLDVTEKCTQALVKIIFNDLKPAFKELFTISWGNRSAHNQILATISDYMSEYRSQVDELVFSMLVEDLLENYITSYLIGLKKAAKLRMPADGITMREDMRDALDEFSSLKTIEELRETFEDLQMVGSMLIAGPDLFVIDFRTFARKHGPQLSFVEAILRARSDLDRSTVNDVMSAIKLKIQQENISERECNFNSALRMVFANPIIASIPTLMSKVSQEKSLLNMFW